MTDDSELEQRLRRDLTELAALPAAGDRQRNPAHGRRPTASLPVALVVVLALVATSFTILRTSDDRRKRPSGSTTTNQTTPGPTAPPTTTKPSPPTTPTTASVPPSVTRHAGNLRQLTPTSASGSWAIVADNSTPKVLLLRTADGGRHWLDVTPPTPRFSSGAFLDADAGWVVADSLSASPPATEPVFHTLDGGRTWKRLGMVKSYCTLQFVDQLHGWCTFIGGALGSATVDIARTSDGGTTWTPVSHTGIDTASSTPAALPFGCEKSVAFTSLTTGWAPFFCAGGLPPLYASSDGGTRWHRLTQVPLPAGAPQPEGAGLSAPVVQGSHIATVFSIGGRPGATAIATSNDDGSSWRSQLVPGAPRYWSVDLIDPMHWRLTDGTVLMTTDDAGRHWRTLTPAVALKNSTGGALTLSFATPSVGWAVPLNAAGPVLSTVDGGATWKAVTIAAGGITVG